MSNWSGWRQGAQGHSGCWAPMSLTGAVGVGDVGRQHRPSVKNADREMQREGSARPFRCAVFLTEDKVRQGRSGFGHVSRRRLWIHGRLLQGAEGGGLFSQPNAGHQRAPLARSMILRSYRCGALCPVRLPWRPGARTGCAARLQVGFAGSVAAQQRGPRAGSAEEAPHGIGVRRRVVAQLLQRAFNVFTVLAGRLATGPVPCWRRGLDQDDFGVPITAMRSLVVSNQSGAEGRHPAGCRAGWCRVRRMRSNWATLGVSWCCCQRAHAVQGRQTLQRCSGSGLARR